MSNMRPTILRSEATYERYVNKPTTDKCFMCTSGEHTTIKEYKHWKIIENNYPYDEVASVHHLLVPKRHMPSHYSLSKDEEGELWMIKHMINKTTDYDCFLENFTHSQSHPVHVHFHLLKWRPIN